MEAIQESLRAIVLHLSQKGDVEGIMKVADMAKELAKHTNRVVQRESSPAVTITTREPVRRRVVEPDTESEEEDDDRPVLKSDAWFSTLWPEGNAPKGMFQALHNVEGTLNWIKDSEFGNTSNSRAMYARKFLPMTRDSTQKQIDETEAWITKLRRGLDSGNPVFEFQTKKAATGKQEDDANSVKALIASKPNIIIWNLFGVYLPPRRGGAETGDFMIVEDDDDASPEDNYYDQSENKFVFQRYKTKKYYGVQEIEFTPENFPWMSKSDYDTTRNFLEKLPAGRLFPETTNWTMVSTRKLGVSSTAFRHYRSTLSGTSGWPKAWRTKLGWWLAHTQSTSHENYVDE